MRTLQDSFVRLSGSEEAPFSGGSRYEWVHGIVCHTQKIPSRAYTGSRRWRRTLSRKAQVSCWLGIPSSVAVSTAATPRFHSLVLHVVGIAVVCFSFVSSRSVVFRPSECTRQRSCKGRQIFAADRTLSTRAVHSQPLGDAACAEKMTARRHHLYDHISSSQARAARYLSRDTMATTNTKLIRRKAIELVE